MTLTKSFVLAAVALAAVASFWAQGQEGKPSAAVLVEKALEERGLEAAWEALAACRASAAGYALDEREFNALGYRLLGGEAFAEAIAVFRMNVEICPESANVYDSLAEAYLHNGDKENTRANYEQVLTRDAENSNAEDA